MSDEKSSNREGSKGVFRNVIFSFIVFAVTFALIFAAGEFLLRIIGKKPYNKKGMDTISVIKLSPDSDTIQKGGRDDPLSGRSSTFERHPTLGYTNLPGAFKIVYSAKNKKTNHVVIYTHGNDTLRITRPVNVFESGPGLWIFGCSFTYGWSVNDNETFPWIIQESLKGYDVDNYGVGGYGTLHSLIQFKESLEKRTIPRLVVLSYASFHNERNTLSIRRRMTIVANSDSDKFPQASARIESGKLMIDMEKCSLPMRRFMEKSVFFYNLVKFYAIYVEPIMLKEDMVEQALVSEFNNECRKRKIVFVVSGISNDVKTKKFLEWCSARGIPTVDISVNLKEEGMTNMPYSSHPSAAAQRIYSEKLLKFLLVHGYVTK